MGSFISFTAPIEGVYKMQAGCFQDEACNAVVGFEVQLNSGSSGSFPYSAAKTSSARFGTTNRSIALGAGETLNFGTCTGSVDGAQDNFEDTFIRLFGPDGEQAAFNDFNCPTGGFFASFLSFAATETGI